MITLKTLKDATAQEVFDQVARHMLTQRKQSRAVIKDPLTNTPTNTCVYRGEGGLKCAAGCLIADDEYKVSFENQNWSSLVSRGEVARKHVKLIQELQVVHDGDPVEKWKYKLQLLAEDFKLEFKGEEYENMASALV